MNSYRHVPLLTFLPPPSERRPARGSLLVYVITKWSNPKQRLRFWGGGDMIPVQSSPCTLPSLVLISCGEETTKKRVEIHNEIK